ncbi:MAG TPA: thioredoxin domain-containing protein [Gemmatimonadaceae bacterium]
MRLLSLRPTLMVVLLAACGRTDVIKQAEARTSEKVASTTTSSANGIAPAGMPRDSISDRADRGRIMGDSNATLWVIMASDFQCPYCKDWHDKQFAAVMQDAAKKPVRIAFWNFPLQMHRNALPASEAAMCASVQNKFWPMHEGLFATQKKWEGMQNPTPLFDSLATASGVNMTPYRECVSKHLTLPLIEADRERARQSGVQSTPTFFVGGEMLLGADKDIHAAIDAALAKGRGAKKPGN